MGGCVCDPAPRSATWGGGGGGGGGGEVGVGISVK